MTTKNKDKKPVWLFAMIGAYGIILSILTVLNWLGADRYWFGTLNLYLPQVLWVVPGIMLVIAAIKLARSWAWLPLLGIVWVMGPVMGLSWSLHPPAKSPDDIPLRVMTWNIKYGSHNNTAPLAIIYEIDRYRPDVILLQDAGGAMSGPLGDYFRDWNVRSFGQYVIASRFPLGEAEVCWISFPGEKHTSLRCQVFIGTMPVTLYNVHFLTPRSGLNAIRAARSKPRYLPAAIEQLENNVTARLTQVRALREYVSEEKTAVIVAGDLNSPDSSQVCATLRDAGLHDAFAEAGRGYGYTYGHLLLQRRLPRLSASWMRIDHVMMSSQGHAERCWTGSGAASDHRPVIADLVVLQQ